LTEELEMVRKLGLGRGLSEQSVVIIDQTGYEGSVRFENEPARHKLLDLIGDISLTGCPLNHLNVVSEKGGHSSNIALAKKLSEAIRIERLKS
jgi:UDP-3-O-[3-hydroxymyristoyl] N-acetylglucosamine deacetylase